VRAKATRQILTLEFIREIYTNFHAKMNLVSSPTLLVLSDILSAKGVWCRRRPEDDHLLCRDTVQFGKKKLHVSEKLTASIVYLEEEAEVFFKTPVTNYQIRRRHNSGDLDQEILYG
jgi:hypothetical protein